MLHLSSFASLAGLISLASFAAASSGHRHAMTFERRASTSVVPSAPGPGDIFREGEKCAIQWTVGEGSRWKSMTIDLMTGANQNMEKVTTVASDIDGTSTSQYSWDCPDVTPNSAIYFYQFTDKNGANPTWTTRFTIASSDGETTAPANTNQPTGESIPWGVGALASGSSASTSSSTSSDDDTTTSSTNDTDSSSSSTSDQDSSSSSSSSSSSGNASNTSSSANTSNTNSQASTKTSGASVLSFSVNFAFASVAVAVAALAA